MIRFRPLLVPTLIAIPGLALAFGLGVWQLQRLEWKEALIAAVDARVDAPAIPLGEALALPPEEAEWRKVFVEGRFLHDSEAYIFAIGPGGQPGLHVVTPLLQDAGGAVLVDRGFIPEGLRAPATRAEGQRAGELRLEGVLRFAAVPSLFTPPPNLAARLWYARDPAGIAAASGLSLAADAIIEADAAPNAGGWPLGGQTIVSFPNNHAYYAVTWFGLALALLAVYLIYHRQQGRLGLSIGFRSS